MTKTSYIDMNHERVAIPEYGNKRANIVAQGFFHQPKDWAELESWIERHSPGDRAHLMTAACIAWNLAARFDAHNEATEKERCNG